MFRSKRREGTPPDACKQGNIVNTGGFVKGFEVKEHIPIVYTLGRMEKDLSFSKVLFEKGSFRIMISRSAITDLFM